MSAPSPFVVFDPQSPQAAAIAHLFRTTLLVCAGILLVVVAVVVWCVVKFRAAKNPDEPLQVTGNVRWETGWTCAAVLVLIPLGVMTVRTMGTSDPSPHRAPDLTVVAHQWWWEARYARGAVTANEIHIQTHTDVLVRVESADVIHDIWVPQLGRKVDAIPGHPNQLWLRAERPGRYRGACSEYCGAQHAWMRLVVVAEPRKQFEAWLAAQEAPKPPPQGTAALSGARLFHDRTCENCHSIRGEGSSLDAGPDLTHLSSRSTLGAGVLVNSPDNLRRWLRDPQKFKPAVRMPDFHLSRAEVVDLAAFLWGPEATE